MPTHDCEKKVELFLGRRLSQEELVITDFLCSMGHHTLDIVAAIVNFLFEFYIASIEGKLGRKLSEEERNIARKLFNEGKPVSAAAEEIIPSPRLQSSFKPR